MALKIKYLVLWRIETKVNLDTHLKSNFMVHNL